MEETEALTACRAPRLDRAQLLALEPHLGEVVKRRRAFHRAADDARPRRAGQVLRRRCSSRAAAGSSTGDARCACSQSGAGWTVATAGGAAASGRGGGRARRRGRPTSPRRSAIAFRSASSAAITCTTAPQGDADAQPAGARSRKRLCADADGARHAPDHRRRIRPPRRSAVVGASRSAGADRRAKCSRSPSGAIPQPWLGRRPCLPDMLPVIGPAPRHKGLWFDFGHQHLGLTLGPGQRPAAGANDERARRRSSTRRRSGRSGSSAVDQARRQCSAAP